MKIWQGIVNSGKRDDLKKSPLLNKVRIPAFIIILTACLSAQNSEESTAALNQDTTGSESANRIDALKESLSEVQTLLKQATDSVAALRESQKIASAAGEGQAGQIATLGDSLAAAKLAKDQLARQIDSLAARQASIESQLKGTTDSLIAVTARQRQSVATSRQQGAEIIQLADSLAGTLQSLRNLESRHDSLSALKKSTALKLASANDSLTTLGILYKSASSITRQQIIKLSSLRDSLARGTRAGREMEAHFDSLLTLKGTLVTQLGQAVDSIAAQVRAMANLRGEIQHRDSLLTGVRDSLSLSVGREADLQARHNAMTALKDSLAARPPESWPPQTRLSKSLQLKSMCSRWCFRTLKIGWHPARNRYQASMTSLKRLSLPWNRLR